MNRSKLLETLKHLASLRVVKIGIVLFLGILTIIGIFVSIEDEPVSISEEKPVPTLTSNFNPPDEDKIELSDVRLDNPYKKTGDVNNYGDVTFVKDPNFEIVYFGQTNQFLISVIGSPFYQKRVLAENQFLSSLGISQDDACKLNVIITTPRHANPNEAGKNYSLSFCEQ